MSFKSVEDKFPRPAKGCKLLVFIIPATLKYLNIIMCRYICVAGLIGSFKTHGGLEKTDSVLDLSLESGFYSTLSYSVAKDLPNGILNNSGLLLVFVINPSRRYLIWICNEHKLYYRCYWDASWNDWQTL